jgi:hypothetical protein
MKISIYNIKVIRVNASITIFAILLQIIYPTSVFAIADGPSQPEFEAYEEFNSKDMVNLITGDFNYNIPLLNIPSPEGGFQVPLTYHAGIELNEESSWVGLGWNINPGVLNRDVSMYPDDFDGGYVVENVNNPGGNGYIKSYPFYRKYYDSKQGSGGTVSIAGIYDFGWGTQKHFGLAPYGLKLKDGKISYDSKYMMSGLSSAASIASIFVSGPLGVGLALASSAYSTYSTIQSVNAANSMKGNSNFGAWTYNMTSDKWWKIWGNKTSYKYYLNQNTSYAQYGYLYLGNIPNTINNSYIGTRGNSYVFNNSYNSSQTTGVTGLQTNSARIFSRQDELIPRSDIYVNFKGQYDETTTPLSLTPDNYSVKGPGVSGGITPYRLDVGSVCNNVSISTLNFTNVGPSFLNSENYKVPFKYQGDYSNKYTYQGLNTDISNSDYIYRMELAESPNVYLWGKNSKYYSNYPSVGNPVNLAAYNTNYNQNSITESNRYGLFNKGLVHGRHVQWFTNSEIINNVAKAQGFIDTHQGYSRSSLPSNGIGGFSITNDEGYTFHFSIPVYNNSDVFRSYDEVSLTTYKVTNDGKYAIMWLLTGITGPDYVDRGTTGVIDDEDWGYYVMFEYGKFASNYTWRNPYFKYNYEAPSRTYATGNKETYYLNRISTRTHSALFIKSLKSDGRSYYESDGQGYLYETVNNKPSSSLKLDDIILLHNSDYQKLISTSQGGIGLNIANSSSENAELMNGDTYNNVFDNYDFEYGVPNSSIQTFINTNQLQKIHFNYNYQLCKGTYNSFDVTSANPPTYDCNTDPNNSNLKGKLTLKSIEFKSKNNYKLLPGYEFYYGNESDPNYETESNHNPNYNPYKYDGYEIYKSGGIGLNNTPHTTEKKADQWSLTKVVTPLGASINVDYERDTYSSIAGIPVSSSPIHLTGSKTGLNSITIDANVIGSTTALSDIISTGDQVKINFMSGNPLLPDSCTGTINSLNGNIITLNNNLPLSMPFIKSIGVFTSKKYGGSIRVKQIKTIDENNEEYIVKYYYTKNNSESGVTSGVASFESPYDKNHHGNFSFYNKFDHPYTPIFYSNVTVVNGRFDNVFKENSKQTFHFVTPKAEMVDLKTNVETKNNFDINGNLYVNYLKSNTIDNTAQIGNLDTIKEFNQFNNLVSKTVFEYTNNSDDYYHDKVNHIGNMGHYSEMSFLWETFRFGNWSSGNVRQKIIQSYKLKRPSFLKSVTTYKDRLVSKQEFLEYDFKTGQALVTLNTYGGIEKYESRIVPAYQKYSELDSKVYSVNNKNMMKEPAQHIDYVYDKNNNKKLIGSSITTWSKNHNYREYNNSTQKYSNIVYSNVWLPKETYVWKSKVDEDGAVNASESNSPFNWLQPHLSGNKWHKEAEITLYDHFSHPLEASDHNGSKSSVRYGYNNSVPVAGCENGNFAYWCYSGAEDISKENDYFEGEVKGANTQFKTNSYSHTGQYCSRIPQHQEGFKFRIYSPPNKGIWRGSVWVHNIGKTAAFLDCRAYSNSNSLISILGNSYYGIGFTPNASSETAGSWNLLNIDVDFSNIPSGTSYIEFTVRNNGSSPYVYADDFRVNPISSPINCSVYDPISYRLLASLDGDNYATKYFYDNSGKMKSIYVETKNGFVLQSMSTYNYAK